MKVMKLLIVIDLCAMVGLYLSIGSVSRMVTCRCKILINVDGVLALVQKCALSMIGKPNR